jgi:hypothetical protein
VRPKALIPLVALLLTGCATSGATLGVVTTGRAAGDFGFGGYRVDARLERDGVPIGTWQVARQPTVAVDPGAYSLVIFVVEVSDVISCTSGGPNPTCIQQTGDHTFYCSTPVTLGSGERVDLEIDLASGESPCRVTRQ